MSEHPTSAALGHVTLCLDVLDDSATLILQHLNRLQNTNRVLLAELLLQGGNVLLLDEPTNDLDVETLRALEEALLDFPGCAVVVSHDRGLLNALTTRTLRVSGGRVEVWNAPYDAAREGWFARAAEHLSRIV